MERPLREASRKRAGNDTRVWLLDHLLALALAFILPGGGTVLAAYLTPADVGGLTTAVYGFLGGLAGLALLMGGTYAAHWFQAPYRQRDEARQRVEYLESESEKPELFDVLPRQSMLGFSIPRLPNGSFHASTAGLGINLPVLIHRGELTKVERLTALPRIWFSQADGQRSDEVGWI